MFNHNLYGYKIMKLISQTSLIVRVMFISCVLLIQPIKAENFTDNITFTETVRKEEESLKKEYYGLSMHGEPKLEKNFPHFPYVNSSAPKGGILTLALLNNFDSLNPFIAIGSSPDTLPKFVLQSLMYRSLDEEFTLYPLLASSYDMPENRSSITFFLNKKALFSDGFPVTSNDVLFSFEQLKNKGKPFYRSSFSKVSKVTQVNDHEIRFDFPDANDRELPLILASFPIFSSKQISSDYFNGPNLMPIIGSGPYKISEIQAGKRITLRRNLDYWANDLPVSKGMYNFDIIIYDFYRDSNAYFEAFKSLLYDYRIETDPARWATEYDISAVKEGKIVKESIPILFSKGMNAFVFNTRRDIFKDKRVREALTYLFDFQWVNQNLYLNTQSRSDSFFSGSNLSSIGKPITKDETSLLGSYSKEIQKEIALGTWHPPEQNQLAFTDRTQAKKALSLLKDAGWVLNKGILQNIHSREPFVFEIIVSTPIQERLALHFSNSLSQIGVQAEVRRIDDVQYWRRVSSFDFDMIQRNWTGSPSPGNEQKNRWGSHAAYQKSSLNYAGIQSPAVDAMIAALLKAQKKEDLVTAIHALDRLLLSGQYVIPLFYSPDQWVAYNSKLDHPKQTPLLGMPIELWWQKNNF